MVKRILLLLALITFVGTNVQAQKFMLGPQLGYFAASEEGADGSVLFGGAARVKFGGLGIEGAINYRSEKQDFYGSEVETSFFPVMLSGLLYPLPIVYATAGIGWYNWKVKSSYMGQSMDYTGSDIGYHLGGGAEITLGSVILSADIKYIFMKYQFEGSNTDYEANGFLINGTLFFPL